MTKSKHPGGSGLIDFSGLQDHGPDPAVQALIGQGQRRESERRMTERERKKVLRERNKAADRNGRRALYDLPPEMIQAIKQLAEANHTTASQVAALALHRFLEDIANERISLRDYRVLDPGPRYEYRVCLEPVI